MTLSLGVIFSLLGLIANIERSFAALTDSEKQFILNAHNTLRSEYCLEDLVWDDTLATLSEAWAGKCSPSHSWDNSGNCDLYACSQTNGENIGVGYTSWDSLIQSWVAERNSFNFNSPSFSETTGHFSQMIWKNTRSIGCGRAGSCLEFGNIFVCQYYPQGNIQISGQDTNCMFRKNIQTSCPGFQTCVDLPFAYEYTETHLGSLKSRFLGCDEASCFGWCNTHGDAATHNTQCCDCGGGEAVTPCSSDPCSATPGLICKLNTAGDDYTCEEPDACTDVVCDSPPNDGCYAAEGQCANGKCFYFKSDPGVDCITTSGKAGYCNVYGDCDLQVMKMAAVAGENLDVIWGYANGLDSNCYAILMDGRWQNPTRYEIKDSSSLYCTESQAQVIVPPDLPFDLVAVMFVKLDGTYTAPISVQMPDSCVKTDDCPIPTATHYGYGCTFNECMWFSGTNFGGSCQVAIFDGDWRTPDPLYTLSSDAVCTSNSVSFVIPELLRADTSRTHMNVIVTVNDKWTSPLRVPILLENA